MLYGLWAIVLWLAHLLLYLQIIIHLNTSLLEWKQEKWNYFYECFSTCYRWMFSTCCKKTLKNSRLRKRSWNLAGTLKYHQLPNDKMCTSSLPGLFLCTVYALKETCINCFNLKTSFYHISLLGNSQFNLLLSTRSRLETMEKICLKKNKYLTFWTRN